MDRQRVHGNATSAAAATATPTAPLPSPSPGSARRRGHRAQSAVWRYLTTAENPHHAISTECMHCRRQVPHHRKNEKARAHLRRCAAFRDKVAALPPDERPAWIDLTASVRDPSSQYTTRRSASQSPQSVAVDTSAGVSDVDMPDASAVTSVQTHGEDYSDLAEQEPSDGQLGDQAEGDVDHNDEHHDNTSIQDAVAMHVYVTGIQVEGVADSHLARAFQLANSAVVLPTPEGLRGDLLDRAYKRVRAKVVADMRLSEYNALSCNGWWRDDDDRSDGDKKRAARYMAVNEAQTFFLGSSYPSETERQDPELLASQIVRLVKRCPRRITGAVTDCTPAHRAAWEKLKATYPSKFFQGCASHAVRLLLQDIFEPTATAPSPLKQLQELVQNCRLLVGVFDRDAAVLGKLQQSLSGPDHRLKSPSTNQLRDALLASFRSIRVAVPALRTVVSAPSFVNDVPVYFQPLRAHITQFILDPKLTSQLDKAIALIELLTAALTGFEQQQVPCSEVFAYFTKSLPDALNKLRPALSQDERRHLQQLSQSRFNAMSGDGHGIAYMLDPRYLGDGLSFETRKSIEDLVFAFPTISDDGYTSEEEMDEEEREEAQLEMAQQLTEFVIDATRERANRTFRFSMLARGKKSVLQYWLTDGQRWPRLQRLACRVFCLPASTIQLTRQAASLAAGASVRCSSALPAGATSIEDKIEFIRINSKLLGGGGLAEVTS